MHLTWPTLHATRATCSAIAISYCCRCHDRLLIRMCDFSYHGADAHSPPKFPFTFGQASKCSTPLANVSLAEPPKKNITPVAILAGVTSFNVTTGDNANYPNPPAWGLSYHLNDYETPVIRLVRGTTYTFRVMVRANLIVEADCCTSDHHSALLCIAHSCILFVPT